MENKPKHKKATSCDIARACGVSQATVSYVLNNKQGITISTATRQRILDTAKQLHYVPNDAASRMRRQMARSIGVIVGRNAVSMGFNHILRGLKQTLDRHGYSITILKDPEYNTSEEPLIPQYLEYIRSGRIDGVAFCYCDLTDETRQTLEDEGIPYILASDNGISTAKMCFGDVLGKATSQCVDFCIEQKFKRILFFSFQNGRNLFSHKFNLFRDTLLEKQADISLARMVIQARDRENEELKAEILKRIQAGGFDLAVTPHQRLGVLVQSAIMENRLAIPQYPKHICLDVAHMMQTIYPSVTSFDIPLTEIGEKSGEQLLRLIAGDKPEDFSFDFSLKLGVSTR